jgi:hypothetical protein
MEEGEPAKLFFLHKGGDYVFSFGYSLVTMPVDLKLLDSAGILLDNI